ncbi:hypothetical protein GTO91_16675 [Heliobacterium undosum]|uniref:Uncharacterized protein n=1 Tax=Heliomicrobium undosum TaxID=121734 RepID=A0A845L3W5_9FIRM|nr:hypothetical protein [Heliomicrobium undosum]MZP31337.1 hypothetical protein [Heliomicrobium undosum]
MKNRIVKASIIGIVLMSVFLSATTADALGDYNYGTMYAVVPVDPDHPENGAIQVICLVQRFFDRIIDVEPKVRAEKINGNYPWEFEVVSYSLIARKKDAYGVVIDGVVNVRNIYTGVYIIVRVYEEV